MIQVRRATRRDASAIGKLVYALLVEIEHTSPNLCEAFYVAEAERFLSGASEKYAFLATDGSGRPLGVLTLGTTAGIYAEGRFGIIHELYVVPPSRSTGVGTLLLDEAKRFAASQGWTRLEVTAVPGRINPRTLGFYQRAKFVEVGSRLKFEIGETGST